MCRLHPFWAVLLACIGQMRGTRFVGNSSKVIGRFLALHWPGVIGCFLLGLPLLVVQVFGRLFHQHTSFPDESWYIRIYGWPIGHARGRMECFPINATRSSDIWPMLEISARAVTLNIVVSIIVLAAVFFTVESVRLRTKAFRFSLSTLLTFVFVVAGVCGFAVFDREICVVMGPQPYVPLAAYPIYVWIPLMAGIAAVFYATVIVVEGTCRWAFRLMRPKGFAP